MRPAWGAFLAPTFLPAQKGQGMVPAKSVDLQELTAWTPQITSHACAVPGPLSALLPTPSPAAQASWLARTSCCQHLLLFRTASSLKGTCSQRRAVNVTVLIYLSFRGGNRTVGDTRGSVCFSMLSRSHKEQVWMQSSWCPDSVSCVYASWAPKLQAFEFVGVWSTTWKTCDSLQDSRFCSSHLGHDRQRCKGCLCFCRYTGDVHGLSCRTEGARSAWCSLSSLIADAALAPLLTTWDCSPSEASSPCFQGKFTKGRYLILGTYWFGVLGTRLKASQNSNGQARLP